MLKVLKNILIVFLSIFTIFLFTIPVWALSPQNFGMNSEIYFNPIKDYIKWNSAGYFEIEMGSWNGTPLKWKMVLKENGNNVESVSSYNQNTALSGSYYFLLDTFIQNELVCSFENSYTYSGDYPRGDSYASTVNPNDYAVSNIREFLTGTSVKRYSTWSGSVYTEAFYTGQTQDENFLDKFNVRNDVVYSLIQPRTLEDLYSKMGRNVSGTESVTYDSDVEIPASTEDKLWLLSLYEASVLGDNTSRAWGGIWWLRTPGTDGDTGHDKCHSTYIRQDGTLNDQYRVYYSHYARPAFKVTI